MLGGKIAGVAWEVNCEEFGGTKTVSNIVVGELMGFIGEGTILLSGCKVAKPVGCTMKSTIETVTLSESSEDLKEEVLRTLFVPKSGTKLATITLEGCALKGSYPLEGKIRSQALSISTEEIGPSTGSELTLAGGPVVPFVTFHDATAANGKTVVRELP